MKVYQTMNVTLLQKTKKKQDAKKKHKSKDCVGRKKNGIKGKKFP